MKCKEYHDWEVTDVMGTLPHQDIELECSKCGANKKLSFEYHNEEDE